MLPSNKNIPLEKAVEAGFSLVELLVVIVMFSILSTAGYNLFREQSRINQSQQNMLELQSGARTAMQVLIQSFSHAGFGCNENISGSKNIAGIGTAIVPNDQNFNGTTPDSVTIVYGYEHVANITTNSVNSTIIPVDSSARMGTTDYTKYISLFPSSSPNTFYEIQDIPSTTSIALDTEITVTNSTKIFRVNPLQYVVVNGVLRERETAGARDEAIIYEIQDFQLAYTEDDSDLNILANWDDDPANPRNVKAVWIYMILRTREREPGYQSSRMFRLPWNPAAGINSNTLPAGFHYQEFQTQVWLRNVN